MAITEQDRRHLSEATRVVEECASIISLAERRYNSMVGLGILIAKQSRAAANAERFRFGLGNTAAVKDYIGQMGGLTESLRHTMSSGLSVIGAAASLENVEYKADPLLETLRSIKSLQDVAATKEEEADG